MHKDYKNMSLVRVEIVLKYFQISLSIRYAMTHTYNVKYPYKSLSAMFPAYRNFSSNSSLSAAIDPRADPC